MKAIYMTKGLPGSGKTTWALDKLKKNTDWKRANKDDLRSMLDDGRWSKHNETFVKCVRDMIVAQALMDGHSVIVDDTNIHPSHETRLRELAAQCGAEFEVVSFLHVGVEECIERDLKRTRSVGERVIRRMHRELYTTKPHAKAALPTQDPNLPHAVIVDIDGTLALKSDRSPFDWHRVGEDAPNKAVVGLLDALRQSPSCPQIILFSGRDGVCMKETQDWLSLYYIHYDKLRMRPEGNCEKDSIIKQRMYDELVRGKFYVRFVLDDRNQVVEMWRQNGLNCFQVAEGNF